MYCLEDKEIEMINSVANLLEPDCQFDSLGDWGILHLVCGAITGQTLSGRSSAFEGLPSPYDIFKYQIQAGVRGEMIALVFSNYIRDWSHYKSAETVITHRIENMKEAMSDKQYTYHHYYLTLAFMLNSMRNSESLKDLNEVRKWAESNENGWEKVFFGAGLLLTDDIDFYWERYTAIIKTIAGDYRKDVNNLFNYFESKR